jgi:hypothetical protein
MRDLVEFLRAKRARREPVRFHAHGVAEATYHPRDAAGFARLRRRLRESRDFSDALDRLDALEHALRKRGGVPIPTPRKLMQNSDRSLSIWWGDSAMVRLFPDGMISMIGGTAGVKAKRVTPELLDLLAFQTRLAGGAAPWAS